MEVQVNNGKCLFIFNTLGASLNYFVIQTTVVIIQSCDCPKKGIEKNISILNSLGQKIDTHL